MAYQAPDASTFENSVPLPAPFDRGLAPMPDLGQPGGGASSNAAVETAFIRAPSLAPHYTSRYDLAVSTLVDILATHVNLDGYYPATHDRAARRRSALIDTLFIAAFPIPGDGRSFLRPLWADEAMNRASDSLQLVLMLERSAWQDPRHIGASLELELARKLAGIFHSLQLTPESAKLPATDALKGVLCGMAGLFGPAIGTVELDLSLTPIRLAPYRRRALVLVAAEIMTKALLWSVRTELRVRAVLDFTADRQLRLLVEHDGFLPEAISDNRSSDIVSGLAALLEAELVYRRSQRGGTAIELLLPA